MHRIPSGSVRGGGPQGCGAEGTTRILVHAPHSERFRAWRGASGGGAEGTTRILVHAPHSERFRAWRGGLRGAGQREPLGSWFMHRIPSGSVRGGGASGVRGRGNHSDPGSCTAFRAVPCVAGGLRGAGRGNHSDPGSCTAFRAVPCVAGGPQGCGAREPLGSWFMHRIPSGSVRGGGAGQREPLGSWFMHRIPSVSVRGGGGGTLGPTRRLVQAPHSARFSPWRGVRGRERLHPRAPTSRSWSLQGFSRVSRTSLPNPRSLTVPSPAPGGGFTAIDSARHLPGQRV